MDHNNTSLSPVPTPPEGVDAILANRNKTVQIANYLSQGWQLFLANPGLPVAYTLILVVLSWIPVVGFIVAAVLSGPLMAGYYFALRKQVLGQPVQFSDYLLGFNNPVPLILLAIVSGALISLGTLLLVLPGIYLAVSYLFAVLLLVDRNLDFWTALETSRKFITAQWFIFLALALLLFAINAAGAMLFGIGLLLTVPFSAAVLTAAYHDLIGLRAAAE